MGLSLTSSVSQGLSMPMTDRDSGSSARRSDLEYGTFFAWEFEGPSLSSGVSERALSETGWASRESVEASFLQSPLPAEPKQPRPIPPPSTGLVQ